jgi:alkyl hydroperoxide reductase subunit AhpF
MNILLLITNHCDACSRAEQQLSQLKKSHPEIAYEIQHINNYEDKRIFITPAWIVNGELFAYGDINRDKLLAKLN